MNTFFDQKYVGGVLIFLMSVFALVLALWISEANYVILSVAVIGVLGATYCFSLSQYWLLLGFILAMFNFQMFPMGIGVRPPDFLLGLALLFVASRFWKPTSISRVPEAQYFRIFDKILLAFLLYLAGHLILNYRSPIPGDYVPTGTAIKTYISMTGGFVFCWTAIHFSSITKLPRKTTVVCLAILAVALSFNIVVRAYGVLYYNLGERELGATEVTQTVITIPIVYLMENQYTLRFLGPIACLVGSVILTSHCREHRTLWNLSLGTFLLFGGLFGSLISMGRVSVLWSGAMITLVMLIRRRYGFFIASPVVIVIALVGIRSVYDHNPKLVPYSVQRAVALVPFMDMDVASHDIEGSSIWRKELAMRALDEWKSTPRIQLLGRSTLALIDNDYSSLLFDPYWGGVRLALRKGTTHNLITDLLILVGAVGLVLYLATYFSLLLGIFRIFRRAQDTTSVHDWSLICICYFATALVYAVIGGAWFETWQSVFFGVTFWLASHSIATSSAPLPEEAWTE